MARNEEGLSGVDRAAIAQLSRDRERDSDKAGGFAQTGLPCASPGARWPLRTRHAWSDSWLRLWPFSFFFFFFHGCVCLCLRAFCSRQPTLWVQLHSWCVSAPDPPGARVLLLTPLLPLAARPKL